MENMDSFTAHIAKTINHMGTIFPQATLHYRKRVNKDFNERANKNPFKIMSLMDGRLEKGREDTERKKLEADPTLKRSYKSVIHNTKREIFREHDRI